VLSVEAFRRTLGAAHSSKNRGEVSRSISIYRAGLKLAFFLPSALPWHRCRCVRVHRCGPVSFSLRTGRDLVDRTRSQKAIGGQV